MQKCNEKECWPSSTWALLICQIKTRCDFSSNQIRSNCFDTEFIHLPIFQSSSQVGIRGTYNNMDSDWPASGAPLVTICAIRMYITQTVARRWWWWRRWRQKHLRQHLFIGPPLLRPVYHLFFSLFSDGLRFRISLFCYVIVCWATPELGGMESRLPLSTEEWEAVLPSVLGNGFCLTAESDFNGN